MVSRKQKGKAIVGRSGKKSSRLKNVLNVQLHEKHLKTLSRVQLLATFHTLQRQQQRHSLCNTQPRSHNHKWVLYKWGATDGMTFLGGC